MSDFTPLGYSVAFLLFVGFVFPFVAGFFVDTSDIQTSRSVQPLTDMIDNGYELDVVPFTDWGTFSINPFNMLGDELKNEFEGNINYLSLLPNFLVIIIMILSIVSIIYSLIKLVP